MTIAIIIVLVLTIAALVYLYLEGKKEAERLNKKIDVLNQIFEDKDSKIKSLQKQIETNKKEIANLSKELAAQKEEWNKKTVLENFAKEKKQIKEMKPKKIYFVKPIENGFPVELQATDVQGTVYLVDINEDEKTAVYFVHTEGANVSEIVRRSEIYLKPGCIEQNFPDKETTDIITETPGTLTLEDNKWIIKEKAVIRYE